VADRPARTAHNVPFVDGQGQPIAAWNSGSLDCPQLGPMTPQEANAVNVIASYLAAQPTRPPDIVIDALGTLASRARNRIQTGWDEYAIARQWSEASASPS
jgi:hypothetical protein